MDTCYLSLAKVSLRFSLMTRNKKLWNSETMTHQIGIVLVWSQINSVYWERPRIGKEKHHIYSKERLPRVSVPFWREIFNECLLRMNAPFLSGGALIWKIVFKGDAHLGIT